MPDNYRILAATPAEYETIREIAHATWPDTFGDILSITQIDFMLEMMYSLVAMQEQVARGHVFHLLLAAEVATDDYTGSRTRRFRPVAYVSHQLDYRPGTTKIHKLYARPQVQGKGYGKVLVEHIAGIARRAGQSTLRLDVNYQNKAVSFYEYLGFEKIERCNTDIGNGYLMEDWIMEKSL
jgi:GNAT superfamily N-acetyltransferase